MLAKLKRVVGKKPKGTEDKDPVSKPPPPKSGFSLQKLRRLRSLLDKGDVPPPKPPKPIKETAPPPKPPKPIKETSAKQEEPEEPPKTKQSVRFDPSVTKAANEGETSASAQLNKLRSVDSTHSMHSRSASSGGGGKNEVDSVILKKASVKNAFAKRSSFTRSRSTDNGKAGSRKSIARNKFLGPNEQAFLPGDLLYRLGQSAGQLPPAPSVFSAQGAVLFVDVSGFTALAEKLGKENVPVKASEKVLASVALDGGGEVGKFAGDALLCVWEDVDLDRAENLAKHAAVNMLKEMEVLNKKEGVDLQIHGGVAKGSIVHFHFGSLDDDLRWYLVSGEAAAAATTTVDVATAAEFCCQDEVAKGLPSLGEGKARRGGGGGDKPNRKTLTRGNKNLAVTILTSESKLPPKRELMNQDVTQAVLRDGLPRSCNVYIPKQLRDQLDTRSVQKGEMRRRIAIVFVEISSLKMTEDELTKRTVNDSKLDLLNNAFVTMTRILHAFEGEVRDMLFDDKGCVYIGMWGAHVEEEDESHPWNVLAVKAAMAICNEVEGARAGVSSGTCFVGFAGVPQRRTDFVVVGHEVNMSARYMSNAKPGQVLVSSNIWQSTKDKIKYGPEQHVMVGKGKWAKDRSVYTPLEESSRRASFQLAYRNSMSGAGLFVGREKELSDVEKNLVKIGGGKTGGVMVVEAPLGRGKTMLLKRVKKMGRGKIKIVSGHGAQSDTESDYFAFRHVLESYTGIRPSMTAEECKERVARLEAGGKDKIDMGVLAAVLPWCGTSTNPTPKDVAAMLFKVVKLSQTALEEKVALLVLDDVQFFDALSVGLLNEVISGLAGAAKVGLLMSFRSEYKIEDKKRSDLLSELKTRLKKIKTNSLWITLPLLSKEETNALATKFIGAEPDEEAIKALFDRTKGDPSFIYFLISWLDSRKQLHRGAFNASVDIQGMPSTCADTVRSLVAECLTPEETRVLQLAATCGMDTFDAKYVEQASAKSGAKLATAQVITALSSAADHELVHATAGKLGEEDVQKWNFAHDMIGVAMREKTTDLDKYTEGCKELKARMKQ